MTVSCRSWPVLCLLLGACATASIPPAADPLPGSDASYSHTPSGFVFPATVDHFHRVDVFRQDQAGQSVSVGYAMDSGTDPITAIVHVYPARLASGSLALIGNADEMTPERSQPQVAVLLRELTRLHPALRVTAQSDAFLVQGGEEQSGRELTALFDDAATTPPQRTVVDAYAFCCRSRNRAVVYRFQYPQASAEAPALVAAFMRDLAWSGTDHDQPQRRAPAMPR